jgi:hypothetical protein
MPYAQLVLRVGADAPGMGGGTYAGLYSASVMPYICGDSFCSIHFQRLILFRATAATSLDNHKLQPNSHHARTIW